MPFPTFRARVPASTSNCGPGFDTLGLAFRLYNEITLTRTEGTAIEYVGSNDRFREREEAMVAAIARAFFSRAERAPFGFSFDIRGEVPLARGLGSSVTVRAGVIGALNAAAGSPLDKREIAGIVADLEGHPDNAAAAIWGGFSVARSDPQSGRFVDATCFQVSSELAFAVVSPDLEIETDVSRRALPEVLPFGEVVKSLNSLAFLVSVFATGEYEKLRGAVTDFVHQPYRLPNIPGAEEAIAAGVGAGAHTGWLSGSGSTVLCASPADRVGEVAETMRNVFVGLGISSEARVLQCDNAGLTVTEK